MESVIKKEVEKIVLEAISKLSGLDQSIINLDAHFVKDLGIDSVNVVELTVAIEKNFKITVDDLVIGQMYSVNSTVTTVLNIMQQE